LAQGLFGHISMRQTFLIILAGLCLGGCASSQQAAQANRPIQSSCVAGREYIPTVATALAFDPSVAVAQRTPDLSREDRGVGAFGGYQALDAETYDVQTDDNYEFIDGPGTYQRQVISDRVGVLYH
jgi:hypothetical protein